MHDYHSCKELSSVLLSVTENWEAFVKRTFEIIDNTFHWVAVAFKRGHMKVSLDYSSNETLKRESHMKVSMDYSSNEAFKRSHVNVILGYSFK